MSSETITFSFGKNWGQFVDRCFSEERVAISKQCLLHFLNAKNLHGRSFLDVGCGSGLSSLAAYDSGAARIVSFDVDPASVETTRRLKALRGDPDNWEVLSGSVLDPKFLASLEPADVVYAWGVLHHTGAMWKAVENASRLMKDDGVFYVALYTTTPASPHWIRVKKKYNAASPRRKQMMELHYVLRHAILPDIIHLRNPLTRFTNYKASRGMSFMSDVRDWLGGYPYEDAKVEEVYLFAREKLGLDLINLATGEANTEYLFRKLSHSHRYRQSSSKVDP